MPYKLTAAHLEALFHLANFPIPEDDVVFVGLRGSSPVDVSGTDFASEQSLVDKGLDYLHPRCTIIQWRPKDGLFAVFPASTVPHIDAIERAVARDGAGANRLIPCLLGQSPSFDRRYYAGDHGLASPFGPHRAFRNDNKLPILRTANDTEYKGDDILQYDQAYDNLHCARAQNISAPIFSSNGCQVILGAPGDSIATGRTTEQGPWRKFVTNVYDGQQKRFAYALFDEGEALRTVEIGATARPATVRFGSQGALVTHLQSALINNGYDVGPAGADGDFGYATLQAVKAVQLKAFGASAVDMIVGPATAAVLGISWPAPGSNDVPQEPPAGAGSPGPAAGGAAAGPGGPGPAGAAAPAAASGTWNAKYNVRFDTLTPGGFYSYDPDDISVRRSERTNNPGALNISDWQKSMPGYVGISIADAHNNRTTIYRTPEHGIAAWYHLLTNRYRYGENGTIVLSTLARKYAGADSDTDPDVLTYLAGWKRYSGGKLEPGSRIQLSNNDDVVMLAHAMFSHELGRQTKIKDEQVATAVRLKRAGQLPA